MQKKPIITVIGAASITFGPKVLRDIINHPQVDGCTLRFCDIHEEHLQTYVRVAQRVNEKIQHSIRIESSTDRRKVLPGSDYVIVSVETSHYSLWQKEFEIPNRLGSRQVHAELGGPGGAFHSLRQIPMHVEIARDIEELCPNAQVMIMSNPLNRICLAVSRATGLKRVVGLCHGVEITQNIDLMWLTGVPGDETNIVAAGTNHFTWILEYRRKGTGEDLYPLAREQNRKTTHERYLLIRRLTRAMFDACWR